MPVSEDHAKDLLRNLPGRLSSLLEDQRYWDLTVLRVYLDHCDEVLFDRPKAGLELAYMAPMLALQIPKRRPGEWLHCTPESEKQQHRDLLLRSHAVLGGALRAGGRLDEAERDYAAAWQVCESGPVSPTARADLYKRHARLRCEQRRFDEALEMIELAIGIYRNHEEIYFADVILMKGYVLYEAGRFAEAAPYFAEALSLTRPMQRSSSLVKRTFHSAVHNLAAALAERSSPDAAIESLGYIKQAQKLLVGKPASINKFKLDWVEGRTVARLGSTRLAERRFNRALKGLLKLDAQLEAAVVALDLSLIHLRHGDWAKLEELASETYRTLSLGSRESEALEALKLWMEGAKRRQLTEESIVSARGTVEGLVRRRRPEG